LTKPNGQSVPSKAIAAACELRKEGSPISIRAVCKRAGIDRKHFSEAYADIARTIEFMSQPDRAPKRGTWDRRKLDLEVWEPVDGD